MGRRGGGGAGNWFSFTLRQFSYVPSQPARATGEQGVTPPLPGNEQAPLWMGMPRCPSVQPSPAMGTTNAKASPASRTLNSTMDHTPWSIKTHTHFVTLSIHNLGTLKFDSKRNKGRRKLLGLN